MSNIPGWIDLCGEVIMGTGCYIECPVFLEGDCKCPEVLIEGLDKEIEDLELSEDKIKEFYGILAGLYPEIIEFTYVDYEKKYLGKGDESNQQNN
jgi:hypothetical protein